METQIKVYCTPLKYTKADDLLTKDTDFMGIFVVFNAGFCLICWQLM